jgi:hypothetical protein
VEGEVSAKLKKQMEEEKAAELERLPTVWRSSGLETETRWLQGTRLVRQLKNLGFIVFSKCKSESILWEKAMDELSKLSVMASQLAYTGS